MNWSSLAMGVENAEPGRYLQATILRRYMQYGWVGELDLCKTHG